MRPLIVSRSCVVLAGLAALALSVDANAAPKSHAKPSPATARPDPTLVTADGAPAEAITPTPMARPVQMQPIGARPGAVHPAPPPPPTPPPPPPPAASVAPVVARAEQCLRTEAPRAARFEPSVKLATDLLIEDLCAAEVGGAALYARNVEALDRFTPQSERAAAGLSAARVDPETGEIVNPPAGDVADAVGALDRSSVEPPPQIRRFAAELVMEAKLAASRAPEPRKAH